MRIFRPVKTNWLSQDWGQSTACEYPDFKVISKPASGICPPGSLSLYEARGMKGHNGRDWKCYFREPVYFSVDWEVPGATSWAKTEKDMEGGIGVDIVSSVPVLQCTEPGCNQIHYVKQRLWHHDSVVPEVWDGKQIQLGEEVACGDSTGLSGGDHVHDAPKWCDASGKGLHADNGYFGAFDPRPYSDPSFVLDYLNLKQDLTLLQQIYALLLQVQQLKAQLKRSSNLTQ